MHPGHRVCRALLTWRPLYWLFRRAPGISLTVTRTTSMNSGETVQLTTTVPAWASAMEIATVIDTLAMAGQARMLHENELLLKTDIEVAHTKWKKITAKLSEAEKNGRKGVGVLSKEERRWFLRHEKDYDEHGPVVTVSDDRIRQAAHDEDPEDA